MVDEQPRADRMTGGAAGSAGPGPAPEPAPSYCYRHPDRETYVSCVRCGRPICPDCMRPASVGYQCPEEVAEARRETSRIRTPLGARQGSRFTGWVTPSLILLCLIAYGFEGFPVNGLTQNTTNLFTFRFELLGLGAIQDQGSVQFVGLATGDEYYRLITAAFLHVGIVHIAFNMIFLYVLGTPLERIFGWPRYLALWVTCAVGGNTLVYLVDGLEANGVGASTAIFGLLAAYFLVARRVGADTTQIVVLIVINLVLSFLPGFNISWLGHLGGLATGVVLGAVFVYVKDRRGWIHLPVALALCGAFVLGAVVKTEAIGQDASRIQHIVGAGTIDSTSPAVRPVPAGVTGPGP
ncbi:MAG: rhomboid family intramembrane serine protease [Frankiaceae bacterium]